MPTPYRRYLFVISFLFITYYIFLRTPQIAEDEVLIVRVVSDESDERQEYDPNTVQRQKEPVAHEHKEILEQEEELEWEVPQETAKSDEEEPHFIRKIVAIGDLHGDLPNAMKVLKMTNVIDEKGDWSGEVDFLVQTGDIIDRGDDTIPIFKMMERLREQAQAKGGVLLSNLGNHEWMNAMGDWRYVWDTEIRTFGSIAARQDALSEHGWLGRAWAQNYSTTTRLPLHPSLGPPNTDYVPIDSPNSPPSAKATKHKFDEALSHAALSFVHGGLAPNFPYLTPYPSRINGIAESLLHKLQARPQPPPHPPNPYPGLPTGPNGATIAEQYLYGGDGPVWYRGWALEDESKACRDVEGVLERIGVRRLIMGHTPTFTNIVSRCNGKVIIIDTGISHAYGGVLSGLSITYSLHPLDPKSTKKSKRKWLEKEVVSAVYQTSSKVLVEDTRELVGAFD